MSPDEAGIDVARLAAWICDAPAGALRDTVLLEACLDAAGAERGVLFRQSESGWRRAAGGEQDASSEPWARGGSASFPPAGVVAAELGGRGLALATLTPLPEGTCESLEDLLQAVLLVEAAGEPGPAAPLPSRATARVLEHDARNALASLAATQQLLDLLGAELEPAERARYDEAVRRECRRAGSLVARGMRGSGDRLGADPRPAAEILREIAWLERAELERAGISLALHVPPEVEGYAAALSESDLARVFRNLITNAREAIAAQAGGRAGAIRVSLLPETCGSSGLALTGLVLSVRDQGAALPEVPLGQLFEEGFTAGKPGGSGLGLAAVRELVVRGGGSLLVERARGGAGFEVWLPARPTSGKIRA
jgi:signal transduction histidine kinase